MSQIQIQDGNIARLQASQRILCLYCGSVAAIVAPAEMPKWLDEPNPQSATVECVTVASTVMPHEQAADAVKGCPPPSAPTAEELRYSLTPMAEVLLTSREPEPGATQVRAPRKKRVELEVKVAAFLAANPNATAEETRAEVGGRSATIAEIYKAFKAAPQSTALAHAPTWAKVVDIIELTRLIADQNAVPS